MERVFAESVGSVVTVEATPPTPGPSETLVRTVLAGICGSDTHAVAGHHPLLPPPYYPGHEALGVVEQAADDGSGPQPGTRVVLKPNVACTECLNCQAGRTNACQQLSWIGCDPSGALPGAMADLFVAPSRNLYRVPSEVSDKQAALVECFATPVHAARVAGDLTGARVVVMGAGTIGLLMLIAARNAGASSIVVTDLDDGKLERARRMGADAAVNGGIPETTQQVRDALGGLADVVFDCVAMEPSARQWTQLVRRSATICIVGVPPRDFVVPMPLIQDWELRIQGCANYTEADLEHALDLANQIPADEIVSAVRPFSEAAEAFQEASQSSSGKVMLSPQGEE